MYYFPEVDPWSVQYQVYDKELPCMVAVSFCSRSSFGWIGLLGYVSQSRCSNYHCNPGDRRTTYQLLLEQLDRFILHSKRIQNSNNSPPEIFTVGADLERAVAIVSTSLA